jgi:hypothetical protein
MAVGVSVPCQSCSGPIGFGDIACPRCHVPVPVGARSSLEARLAASSSEFRELKDTIETARTTLLALGAVEIGYGVFLGFIRANAEQSFESGISAETVVTVVGSMFTGAIFFGLFFLVQSRPATALWLALGTWLAPQVVEAIAFPLSVFRFAALKLMVLVFLVRGILSARKAQTIRQRLSDEAIRQRSTQQ